MAFEGSDVIEIRDGISFDFYTGLPHIHVPIFAVYIFYTHSQTLSKTCTVCSILMVWERDSPVQKSKVIPSRILIASLCLKRHITELR